MGNQKRKSKDRLLSFNIQKIDWLLLNVQRAVFQLYSRREQVQKYITTI